MGETIPDFHNMELRLRQLREAVSADKAGRVASVKDILAELERDADEMCLAERLYRMPLFLSTVIMWSSALEEQHDAQSAKETYDNAK